jgi:predicted transcriptional regulator
MSEDLTTHQEVMSYVIEIASAYFANNEVPQSEISEFMKQLYCTVLDLLRNANGTKHRAELVPAVPIEDSVHDDYIVCLEDGKRLQMLKRHLSTVYDMSIEQYKEKWGLSMDYPVVSPNYAKKRSKIAKTTGLGNSGRKRSNDLKVA